MEISDVRVKLVRRGPEKLRAFCSVTIDNAFVVRDLRVVEGAKGYFVAMPSRKLMDRCPRCSSKNHLRARFCNGCGARLAENRARKDFLGKLRLHIDTAHPISSWCRDDVQRKVLEAFHRELESLEQPEDVVPLDSLPNCEDLDEVEGQPELLEEAEPATSEKGQDDIFGKGLF